MPNRRLSASVVENSVLVRKLAWFAASDGIACASRNTAISTMDRTITRPEAGGEPLEYGVAARAARLRPDCDDVADLGHGGRLPVPRTRACRGGDSPPAGVRDGGPSRLQGRRSR